MYTALYLIVLLGLVESRSETLLEPTRNPRLLREPEIKGTSSVDLLQDEIYLQDLGNDISVLAPASINNRTVKDEKKEPPVLENEQEKPVFEKVAEEPVLEYPLYIPLPVSTVQQSNHSSPSDSAHVQNRAEQALHVHKHVQDKHKQENDVHEHENSFESAIENPVHNETGNNSKTGQNEKSFSDGVLTTDLLYRYTGG